jgi:hypothetical protein
MITFYWNIWNFCISAAVMNKKPGFTQTVPSVDQATAPSQSIATKVKSTLFFWILVAVAIYNLS